MTEQRTVQCVKLGKELPGMPFKPFQNELGQQIYDNVSLQAWQMWLQESPRYINTYQLDLGSQKGREFLEEQMRVFFGLAEGEMAQTAWVSPEQGAGPDKSE